MFQDNQPEQTPQPENTQQQPVQEQVQAQEQTVAQAQPQPQVQQGQQQVQQQSAPVASVSVQAPEKTTQEERMWAAIGYIAFLGVVALAMKPKSEFCKHHATQGLTIFALWFVSLILLAMPSFIGAIGGLLLLGSTGLAVFGIIKAIQSYKLDLPVISSIAKKIPTDSIIGSVTGKTPVQTEQSQEPVQNVQNTENTNEQTVNQPQQTQEEGQQPTQNEQTPPPSPPQV